MRSPTRSSTYVCGAILSLLMKHPCVLFRSYRYTPLRTCRQTASSKPRGRGGVTPNQNNKEKENKRKRKKKKKNANERTKTVTARAAHTPVVSELDDAVPAADRRVLQVEVHSVVSAERVVRLGVDVQRLQDGYRHTQTTTIDMWGILEFWGLSVAVR